MAKRSRKAVEVDEGEVSNQHSLVEAVLHEPDVEAVVQEPEEVVLSDTKLKRKPMSMEARRRFSVMMKERFKDPVLKQKMSEAAKAYWSQPEARQQVRESVKAYWTPERRAEQAAKLRAAFAKMKEAK
jgi:hypothetical protein